MFADRYEAGRILGEMVSKLPNISDGVVLGLVRGGVPVAFEVAKACSMPLDISWCGSWECPGSRSWQWGRSLAAGQLF